MTLLNYRCADEEQVPPLRRRIRSGSARDDRVCGGQGGVLFGALLDYVKDGGLQVGHHGVGPEVGVPVEIGGEAMMAGEVETGLPIGKWLENVFPVKDVEEWAADYDVFVQRGGRNSRGLGLNGKRQPAPGLPIVDRLDEQHSASE